ncbi:MAG: cob(I)yrinic acid a,c-diamide adenosyltransferase [Armatimonadetes bacterium]|nr:cob(I)yrinic acid a,c-diamide adenosyltransferase [Armatimonadota bacterium]
MPRIYTRTGDRGETGLIGGSRVPKDDLRVEAYGALDEACSALGLLAVHVDAGLAEVIQGFQRTLFEVGSEMATPKPAAPGPGAVPGLGAVAVLALEALIDGWEAEIPPQHAFILPGGSAPAAICHLARALVRRAERRAVTLARSAEVNPEILRYLNRLSDCLFVLARLLNHRRGVPDLPWEG